MRDGALGAAFVAAGLVAFGAVGVAAGGDVFAFHESAAEADAVSALWENHCGGGGCAEGGDGDLWMLLWRWVLFA